MSSIGSTSTQDPVYFCWRQQDSVHSYFQKDGPLPNGGFFHCHLCPRQFRKAYSLKRHLTTHDPKRFRCPSCRKLFQQQCNVIEHLHKHRCQGLRQEKRKVGKAKGISDYASVICFQARPVETSTDKQTAECPKSIQNLPSEDQFASVNQFSLNGLKISSHDVQLPLHVGGTQPFHEVLNQRPEMDPFEPDPGINNTLFNRSIVHSKGAGSTYTSHGKPEPAIFSSVFSKSIEDTAPTYESSHTLNQSFEPDPAINNSLFNQLMNNTTSNCVLDYSCTGHNLFEPDPGINNSLFSQCINNTPLSYGLSGSIGHNIFEPDPCINNSLFNQSAPNQQFPGLTSVVSELNNFRNPYVPTPTMDVPSFNSSSDSHTTSSQLPVLNPLYSDSYNGQNAPYGSTPAANHSLPGMSFYLSDLRNGHESSQPEPTVDNNSFDPFSSDPSISGALFTQFEADPAIMNTLFQS